MLKFLVRIAEFLPSKLGSCPQLFLNAENLVVLCQALRSAWGTCLDLKRNM